MVDTHSQRTGSPLASAAEHKLMGMAAFAVASVNRARATLLPALLATSLVVLTAYRALSGIDLTWDSISYHLPFVALRAGFVRPEQFQIGREIKLYFDGFPPLYDYIRGCFWIVSGRIEAVNLLNLVALLILVSYVSLRFRASISWCVIGLFAIPAVQTAASTNYIDVAANCFVTIVVMSVCEVWIDRNRVRSKWWWAVLFAASFMAANSKLQMGVITILALAGAIIPVAQGLRQQHLTRRSMSMLIVAAFAALAVIEYKFIQNLILFGNPIYPVGMRIGPLKLRGPLVNGDSSFPQYLNETPRAFRWLLSVLEYRALELRPIPYTNGMGEVPEYSDSSRMGGFFGFLSFFSSVLLIRHGLSSPTRTARVYLCVFIGLTTVVAFMPGAYESRYYLCWMMFAVLGTIILINETKSTDTKIMYEMALLGSLVFVSSVTGLVYFRPVSWDTKELISQADRLLDENIEAGDVICAVNWNPREFLLAPYFHRQLAAQRPYSVKIRDCDGLKEIPSPF